MNTSELAIISKSEEDGPNSTDDCYLAKSKQRKVKRSDVLALGSLKCTSAFYFLFYARGAQLIGNTCLVENNCRL